MRLLIATQNKGKLRELQNLLSEIPVTLILPDEVGLSAFEVAETGGTLGENAILKATAFARESGLYAISDDTGLYVDALNGEPGIYPARYGGPGLDAAGRRRKLLDTLGTTPLEQRTTRFECVVALANPQTGECVTQHGQCPGRIGFAERGAGGFGYDSLFIPDGYEETFAEIAARDEVLKDRISHRGDAVRKMIPLLIELAAQQPPQSD